MSFYGRHLFIGYKSEKLLDFLTQYLLDHQEVIQDLRIVISVDDTRKEVITKTNFSCSEHELSTLIFE